MALTDIVLLFLGDYLPLFIAFFGVGVSVLLTRSYSQAGYVYTIISLVCFFIFNNPVFIALSIGSAIISTILKNTGM